MPSFPLQMFTRFALLFICSSSIYGQVEVLAQSCGQLDKATLGQLALNKDSESDSLSEAYVGDRRGDVVRLTTCKFLGTAALTDLVDVWTGVQFTIVSLALVANWATTRTWAWSWILWMVVNVLQAIYFAHLVCGPSSASSSSCSRCRPTDGEPGGMLMPGEPPRRPDAK